MRARADAGTLENGCMGTSVHTTSLPERRGGPPTEKSRLQLEAVGLLAVLVLLLRLALGARLRRAPPLARRVGRSGLHRARLAGGCDRKGKRGNEGKGECQKY